MPLPGLRRFVLASAPRWVWNEYGGSAMLKFEYLHYLVLRFASEIQDGNLGRSTTWAHLTKTICDAGFSGDYPEVMNTLLQLTAKNALALKKIQFPGSTFLVYDYSECPNQRTFFWGQFNLIVTPEGATYFEVLEAKLMSRLQRSDIPPQKPQIGFHS